MAEDTSAAEAALEIKEVPARFRCRRCEIESELNHPPYTCLHCGAPDVELVSGNQVLVDEVELESGTTVKRREVAIDEILEEHLKEHHAHTGDHEHET